MTEQERPRTEAGRRLLEGDFIEADYDGCNIDTGALLEGILAIEAEGRQQAVREAVDLIMSEPYWPRLGAIRRKRIAERVAGLNASESPPTLPQHFVRAGQLPEVGDASESPPPCPVCGSRTKDHDGFAHDAQAARYNTSGLFDPNGRPASESPPTSLEAELSRIEATYPTWDERHPLPTADELLRDLVQHWDAGDIDHDYDAITSAFDAARDHVRATIGLSGEHRHPVAPGQQRLHATMCFDGDCPQCVGDASESGQPPEASHPRPPNPLTYNNPDAELVVPLDDPTGDHQ